MTDTTTTTCGFTTGPSLEPRSTPTIQDLVDRSAGRVNRVWALSADVDDLHHEVIENHADLVNHQLDERAQELAAHGAKDLLEAVAARGLSWRDIAALVDVSVPAVRKWRAGGTATGENVLRMGRLLALLEWLGQECHIVDVASWLEVPLRSGVPVSRLTLLVAGRQDLLVASLVGHETSAGDLLDAFDPGWQERFQSDFEVFKADDGQRSIRNRTNRS